MEINSFNTKRPHLLWQNNYVHSVYPASFKILHQTSFFTMKLIVSSLSLLVLSFLWIGELFCNRCSETYVEAKLPFGHGSCEIKLWKFCLSFSPWIGGQISKSWTYVGIQTSRLKTLEMPRMISTSVWLWSRLPTTTDEKWERMGCGWMLCLIHVNWICSVCFLKWPWLQTVSRCWRRCQRKTWSLDCGQRLLLLPSSISSFQNSLSWLKYHVFRS
jgi:hypothetical protein